MDKNNLKRKCIQLASALLYNANFAGFQNGTLWQGDGKGVCVPGLNCYSCPGAVGSCPLGALQNALSNLPKKLPLYVGGFLLLAGITLGRLICGFLCPFGLIQELLHKIPGPKIPKSRWTRRLSLLKYVILALFAAAIPICAAWTLNYPLPSFCKYICPAGTLEGGWPLALFRADIRERLGGLFLWKSVLCIFILLSCVFCYRAFCRFLCPLGAIYSLFARIALFAMRVDRNLCDNCGLCVKKCPMDVCRVGDRECVQCGACRKVCPKNAIYFGKERKE